MARRPAWYYNRQAARAEARETYQRTYQGPPETAAITQRGPTTEVFYRSMSLRDGTDALNFTVSVLNETLTQITATEAGLLTVLTAGEVSRGIRNSGVKPTRAHWYRGDPTPSRQTSAWGTRYTRSYAPGSHASIPFSRATAAFTPDDLRDAFTALFGPGGTKRTLLGAANGRAYLELEVANLGFNS